MHLAAVLTALLSTAKNPLRSSRSQHYLHLSRATMMSSSNKHHIIADSPSQFDSQLKSASSKAGELGQKSFFVLFTGKKNDTTGKSWCPDCVAAEPVIEKALSELDKYVFLECLVEREEYRRPEYMYRTDDRIRLKCVPTLQRVTLGGKTIAQLDDSQSQQSSLVVELLADE